MKATIKIVYIKLILYSIRIFTVIKMLLLKHQSFKRLKLAQLILILNKKDLVSNFFFFFILFISPLNRFVSHLHDHSLKRYVFIKKFIKYIQTIIIKK